jgi:anti-sigma factor RsiW
MNSLNCDAYQVLLMGYLDGELDEPQRADLEEHLESCAACRAERGAYESLNRMVRSLESYSESERALERYWNQTWNRTERKLGWAFTGIGFVILVGFGLFEFTRAFWTDPTVPIVLRVGAGFGGVGVLVLLASLIRERVMLRKKERYTEVQR